MTKSRTTFLLVPGGPGLPASYYQELKDLLSKHGDVLFPAAQDPFPRSIAEATDHLIDLVSGVKGRSILVGHSFGAAVAIEALVKGVHTAGAIFISGFDSGRMLRDSILHRRENLPSGFHSRYGDGSSVSTEEVGNLLFEYWVPTHFCRCELPESLQKGVAEMDQEFMTHFLGANFFEPSGAIMDWNRSGDLHRIAAPVLLLGGAYDYFGPDETKRMCDQIPDCRRWQGAESSHNCWIEEPEAVAETMSGFLGTLSDGHN